MIVHVLKTWYVSIKTEYKKYKKSFSKQEKISYKVLNGHQQYSSCDLSFTQLLHQVSVLSSAASAISGLDRRELSSGFTYWTLMWCLLGQ